MIRTSKTEVPQKSVLQIKEDDKFFNRLLSKESSMSNPSFRTMHVPIAVPFVWESQPGTPKLYTFSEDTLPPLTPPPSYYLNSCTKPVKRSSRSNLFLALFPKLSLKKTTIASPSSYSSSWSRSSSENLSSKAVVPMEKVGRRRFLSFGSSFDFRGDSDDVEEDGDCDSSSPTSTLCFGIPRSTSTKVHSGFRGSCRR